ncbi:MAG: hypothetical protein RIR34_1106, partial [Actinomycetota bacterium]
MAKAPNDAAKRVIGAAIAAAILAAGFVIAPSVMAAAQPTSKAEYLGQKVSWNSCGTDLYCGKVQVPMDWSNLKSKSIGIAVIYHRASVAKPLGSVIFNPGGPGASGYDFVQDSLTSVGTNKLRQNYNFVGFDPRGVQHSSPAVSCYSPAQLDGLLYGSTGYPLGSAKDLAESRKSMAKFAAACAKKTGPALGFIDTISAAKDLDVLRSVMGDSKLNYLGYSYGTLLGATYASLFPTKVGRMVLDGAVDPTVSNDDQSVIQLKGFDNAFNNYLTDCMASSNCPFSGTLSQARAKVSAFLKTLETTSIPSTDNNREVNVWGANAGIDMALYSNAYWPILTQAFTQAFKGDGTMLLRLADLYNDRNSD